MVLRIDIDNREVSELLAEIERRLGDRQEPLEAIGEFMMGEIDNQFREEVDPFGVPWRPNSPWTIERKRREGAILKILQRTGYMRASANYAASPTELRVGFADPKALKHQTGDGVPVRQLLGVSDRTLAAIRDLLEEYLLQY